MFRKYAVTGRFKDEVYPRGRKTQRVPVSDKLMSKRKARKELKNIKSHTKFIENMKITDLRVQRVK
tara:strand:- start:244 stop:441 length:198 start_codon:yes stop_codon:yes gene_type:complete